MNRKLLYLALALGALLSAFPFVWMLATALKTLPEASQPSLKLWPDEPQWNNFVVAFQAAPFARYFYNSFVVAGAVTISVTLTGLAAAYAFARLEFPGRSILFTVMLAGMLIPFEVMLIPNFIMIRALGWYNTYAALIVPWAANAFSIFLLRQALRGIPRDYADAAMLDGCGHLRFLFWIAAPLVRPMLVTVALFAFLGSYNSLVWPLIVTGSEDMRVAQVGLTVFTSAEGVRYNLLMAASAIVILPTVLIYFAAQRYFIDGALSAGLKG